MTHVICHPLPRCEECHDEDLAHEEGAVEGERLKRLGLKERHDRSENVKYMTSTFDSKMCNENAES